MCPAGSAADASWTIQKLLGSSTASWQLNLPCNNLKNDAAIQEPGSSLP